MSFFSSIGGFFSNSYHSVAHALGLESSSASQDKISAEKQALQKADTIEKEFKIHEKKYDERIDDILIKAKANASKDPQESEKLSQEIINMKISMSDMSKKTANEIADRLNPDSIDKQYIEKLRKDDLSDKEFLALYDQIHKTHQEDDDLEDYRIFRSNKKFFTAVYDKAKSLFKDDNAFKNEHFDKKTLYMEKQDHTKSFNDIFEQSCSLLFMGEMYTDM